MIKVAIEHRTAYRFDRRVRLSPHLIRLRPAPNCRTPVLSYSLDVLPRPHFRNWQQDPFGNFVAHVVFPEPVTDLAVTVGLVADMTTINPFDFFLDEAAERFPFGYPAGLGRDLAPYLAVDAAGPLLQAWVADARQTTGVGLRTVDALVLLNQRLKNDVAYTVRMEPGIQEPDITLEKALGSCRDTAWLLVQILRHLGVAARFVSGYLVQLALDRPPLDGPPGPAADFTDLHAWAEAYVPGAGWIGLDPTSGLVASEGHLPLACTPEPESAAPITGSTEPCEVAFEFTNSVRRVHEDPRVTLPYRDDQWAAIDALGHFVDDDLLRTDARLTMGGEPTFVSVDDMEALEWTFAADGADKRAKAWELAERLRGRFAPSGLIQHCQGKSYPGEVLPRWQIDVCWLGDGTPLWRDAARLADPARPGDSEPEEARELALGIARRLGIRDEFCLPVYEDPVARLAGEAALPPGLPPPGDERAALLADLAGDGAEPVGWVVPVHRHHDGVGGWATSRWETRRGQLFLVPGDSPIGLRLPLGSLVWSPAHPDPDRSLFDPRKPPRADRTPTGPARVVPARDAPPTALCVEVRQGRLHVFLPPLTDLADAVELVAVVEEAVAAYGRPVVVEGYPLPADPHLCRLSVTPDPGVIEVNVHPAASWPALVASVTGLYEEARAVRLGTEKFSLDGTHSGTGGGCHITLGGPTPADSPLLRRPDLLRSLVTYWQHHPALSYLFSGRFVGQFSQAPRVDEASHAALDELEIAFAELDRLGADAPPWLVDRLLRHLLVDVSGNTHRAEFCIDKLFDPNTERGRLGLVELRGFEMPPHPRMALVQALLVRALVARCWQQPYRGRLIRWGTELHDRFLLPWFIEADITEVVDDLREHGYQFHRSWLEPFFEFRFPRIGAVDVGGVGIELRAAIEPWPVLGDEVTAVGTARAVDSSMERLQVLVEGAREGRHVLACNGVRVPLHPTGDSAVSVAGIRYRAWQPPSCLHPTIGVHTPLVFDLVDERNGLALGGCTYHVSHPGGRAYEDFPVNVNSAEARRAERFEPFGSPPGTLEVAGIADFPVGYGYPRTLDLRTVRS
ncbi:MAG TPA: transglutaminase family protein [Acidimicrobiales bacterium]